ncbi:recombinase family protein [Clostridium neuense]|uniref:Recombinase family protein n=1 Tax=Clostridium neuense TaxID=1728934 RepID=A0ABW8TFW1_9CLOT
MIAAIYSRKSKFTGKGESIENQIELCREYCKNNLRDKNITDFLIYEDEGFSGKNIHRPQFQKMLIDAAAKKFDILICYRLDRISRNVADFSTLINKLHQLEIGFVSIREQFDTTTPMGRAMMYIASVFAQLERETIAERVRDNMLELAKTGRWLGGTIPLGYTSLPITYIDEDMKERKMVKLKQVPEELKTIKTIFKKYLELKSLSQVETYALQNNLKTKRGANFSKSNIKIILNNPVYVKADDSIIIYLKSKGITTCGIPDGEHGILTYNKQKSIVTDDGRTIRNTRDTSEWIAAVSSQKGIIEADKWIEVQKILCENKDKFPNEGKTHNALLTGKLKCALCDSNMQVAHGHVSKKTGQKIFYYVCPIKKHSKNTSCSNKNAKVAEVDPIVITKLKNLAVDRKSLLDNLMSNLKISNDQNEVVDKEETLTNLISEKERQIENLITKLSIDSSIDELLIKKIKELKLEVEELKNKVKNTKLIKEEYNDTELTLSFINMLLNRCSIIDSLDLEEQKELIHNLIDEIYWNGNDDSLEITFIGGKTYKKNDF